MIYIPLHVCLIKEFLSLPKSVGEVVVDVIVEEEVRESNAEMEVSVKHHYIKNLLKETMNISQEEIIKNVMLGMTHIYNINSVTHVIYLAIACLDLNKFYKSWFLFQYKSSDIQDILETFSLAEKHEKVLKLNSDMLNKRKLWEQLEVIIINLS
jgi:hypothetical protein